VVVVVVVVMVDVLRMKDGENDGGCWRGTILRLGSVGTVAPMKAVAVVRMVGYGNIIIVIIIVVVIYSNRAMMIMMMMMLMGWDGVNG
jgi:hypothetical protein